MPFHFPWVVPLISDRSVWHNGKQPLSLSWSVTQRGTFDIFLHERNFLTVRIISWPYAFSSRAVRYSLHLQKNMLLSMMGHFSVSKHFSVSHINERVSEGLHGLPVWFWRSPRMMKGILQRFTALRYYRRFQINSFQQRLYCYIGVCLRLFTAGWFVVTTGKILSLAFCVKINGLAERDLCMTVLG